MAEKMDIEELKDVVALVLDLTDCTYLMAADGKLDFGDIGHFWSIIEKVGPALVGIKKVPAEFKDLSAAECDELIEYVMMDLSTPEDVSKVILEKALRALKACYEVYLAVRG